MKKVWNEEWFEDKYPSPGLDLECRIAINPKKMQKKAHRG